MADYVKVKKDSDSAMLTCCSDGEHYPYGTSLSFDDDMIDELGIGALAVEDIVEIKAVAFVDSKSEHSNKENSHKSIRLQITAIKVDRKSDDPDAVETLYG